MTLRSGRLRRSTSGEDSISTPCHRAEGTMRENRSTELPSPHPRSKTSVALLNPVAKSSSHDTEVEFFPVTLLRNGDSSRYVSCFTMNRLSMSHPIALCEQPLRYARNESDLSKVFLSANGRNLFLSAHAVVLPATGRNTINGIIRRLIARGVTRGSILPYREDS